jgi:quercetin dioxygenase-like cupin family protein
MINLFKIKKSEDAISKFREVSDLMISYKDLSSIPLNETVQMVKGKEGRIECTRISSTNKESLMFTVTMLAGEVWQKHHHDCEEVCLVYRGKLTDMISGKSAEAAQALVFAKFTTHFVKAEQDTIFYVEFKTPQ